MKKITIILSILALLVSLIALPIDTNAKTVSEFEAEVKKYTKQLEETKASLAKNDAEVAQIEKTIASYEKQIEAAEEDMKRLQNEIDTSNKEIKAKSEESKRIISYYQISNGENVYLEYAFGATSITDMIYRMSVVEQLTEYNERIMQELEELIAKNKEQQKKLIAKKENLIKLTEEQEFQKRRIQADNASLQDTVPSLETQIKEAKAMVAHFQNLGCGDDEDIQECQYRVSQNSASSLPSVGFFSRPMQKGYVVRGYNPPGHIGYDLSSSNKTEPIYPIAAGSIHAIYTDNCTGGDWCQRLGFWCNGNAKVVVVKHNYNNQYIYSSYAHLSGYGNISVGQFVTKDTVIGYMGNTGCSTGPHLHIEIADCFWKNNGGCTYGNNKYKTGYLDRMMNPKNLITFPSSWNTR